MRYSARQLTVAAGVAASLACAAPAGWAQTPVGQPLKAAPTNIDPDEISGKDFAGVRFVGSPQPADLKVAANRVWVWSEPTSADIALDTRRLYLQGDVHVTLGSYRFTAVQAVVWIEPLKLGEGEQAKNVSQVAIYFDRVSDPGAQAGISQSGDRLLVTGLIEGDLRLAPDSLKPEPSVEAFVGEAEQRLARLLRQLVTGGATDAGKAERPPQGATEPVGHPGVPITPGMSKPYEPDSPLGPDRLPEANQDARLLPPAERRPAIFAKKGIITFAVGLDEPVKVIREGDEYAALMSGGVMMVYSDRATSKSLQVSAQRAVVFAKRGNTQDVMRSEAENIEGVYLEGDVVGTDGQYTIRGQKVYYDIANNRALLLDAVFYTYDEEQQMPVYLRAEAIRQEARGQFSANHAKLAMSSFFEPHLSIGVSSVTVTQTRGPGNPTIAEALAGLPGKDRNVALIDAKGVTGRVGGVPFFYWPRVRGDNTEMPLSEIRVESSSGSGAAIKTRWDIFGLLGLERPEELRAHLLLDGYFDRGPAFGGDFTWKTEDSRGDLLAYMIANDSGRDHLSSGARIDQDGKNRGLVVGEHVWDIDSGWKLFGEMAYFSDETFVDAFYRGLGESHREFKNNVMLQGIENNWDFSFEAGAKLNDFTVNQWQLQSPGYQTIKQPELRYSRINDDLLSGDYPGLVSWSQQWRLSRMYLNFTESTPRELGFDTVDRAREAFGLLPDDKIGDRLRARGLTESSVLRGDTKQEFSTTWHLGPVTLTPFVTGHGTVYDDDFKDYSADATDAYRLWGAAGMRASTTIQHIDNSVDNDFFDLHRIRHIIEPNVQVWTTGQTLDQNDLPVYDPNVESLASGSVVKAGVTQTWQTQRGGPGRMHSVDVFRLTTEIVESSGDADRESPILRFFDSFPEYSLLGDFTTIDGAWQVSDALALSFNEIYDFETNQSARTSAGGTIQHSEDFSTFAEARYINARDITLVDFGLNYKLTKKYSFGSSVTLDADEGDVQTVQATIRRRFPDSTLGLTVRYNNISSETSIGVVIEPLGQTESRTAALRRRLGNEDRILQDTRGAWGSGMGDAGSSVGRPGGAGME